MGADPVRAQWPGQGRGARGHPGQGVPWRCRHGGHGDSGRPRRRWPDGRPPSAHPTAPASPCTDRPGIRPTAMGTGTAAGQRTAVGPSSRAAPWRNGIAAQARADAPGTAVLGRAGRGCLAGRSPWRSSASTGLLTGRPQRWRPSRPGQHRGCSGDGSQASWSADACRRPGAPPARCSGTSAADPRTPRSQEEPGCRGNPVAYGSVRASTGRRPPRSRFGILHGQQVGRSRGQPTD